jgi:hypothetical protein
MMKPFRYGILSATADCEAKADEAARKEDVVYELQVMFGNLMMSERRCFNPAPWCYAYKDETGRPTNFLIQQDAQVYESLSPGFIGFGTLFG